MCDDEICQVTGAGVSRRAFGASAAAAGVAAFAASHAAAAAATVETNVDIRTPDGTCDAALYHPAGKGTWPAVLIWTDNLTLRPAFRALGARLAAQGYVVLVPNPYYRVRRAPTAGDGFDYGKAEDRAKLQALSPTMTAEGCQRDAVAFLAFLDAQPQTDKRKKAGTAGYCMGGPLSVWTAAALPARVGAVATFHGSRMATAAPTSPHKMAPLIKAEVRCAIARDDDAKAPDDKVTPEGGAGRGEAFQQRRGLCRRPRLVHAGQRHL